MANEYWVVPIDAAWVVRFEGGELERFDDKMRAVLRAQGLAKENRPSEVMVLDRSGAVSERRTFPAND